MSRPCSSAQVEASASDSPGSSRSRTIARARGESRDSASRAEARWPSRPQAPAGRAIAAIRPRPPASITTRPRGCDRLRRRGPIAWTSRRRAWRSFGGCSWSIARPGSIVSDDQPPAGEARGSRRAAIAGGFDSPSAPTQDSMKRDGVRGLLRPPSPDAPAGSAIRSGPPAGDRGCPLASPPGRDHFSSMRKAQNGVG